MALDEERQLDGDSPVKERGCTGFMSSFQFPEYSRIHAGEHKARVCVIVILVAAFVGAIGYQFARLVRIAPSVIKTDFIDGSYNNPGPGIVVCGQRLVKPPTCKQDEVLCPPGAITRMTVQNFTRFLADLHEHDGNPAAWPCWVFGGGPYEATNVELNMHSDLFINDTTSSQIPEGEGFMYISTFNREEFNSGTYRRTAQPRMVQGPSTVQIRFTQQVYYRGSAKKRNIILMPTVFDQNKVKSFDNWPDVLAVIQMEPLSVGFQERFEEVASFTVADFVSQIGGVITVMTGVYKFLFGTFRLRPFGLVQRITLRDTAGSSPPPKPPSYSPVDDPGSLRLAEEGTAGFCSEDGGPGPAAGQGGDASQSGPPSEQAFLMTPAMLSAMEQRISLDLERRITGSVMCETKQFLSRYYVRNVNTASRVDTHVIAKHQGTLSRAASMMSAGPRSRHQTAGTDFSINSGTLTRPAPPCHPVQVLSLPRQGHYAYPPHSAVVQPPAPAPVHVMTPSPAMETPLLSSDSQMASSARTLVGESGHSTSRCGNAAGNTENPSSSCKKV